MPGQEGRKFKKTIHDIIERLVVREDGCIVWSGSKIWNGYGQSVLYGVNALVHRSVYEHFRGKIPDGLVLDHLCRNRACANPYHLEAVTASVNSRRGENHNKGKTHCKRGHPLSGGNLYITPDGRRLCRECRRAACAKWREAKIAQ